MKKFLFLLALAVICIGVKAQTQDANPCDSCRTYANHEYVFTWELSDDFQWEVVPPTKKESVFSARARGALIDADVFITKLGSKVRDVWEYRPAYMDRLRKDLTEGQELLFCHDDSLNGCRALKTKLSCPLGKDDRATDTDSKLKVYRYSVIRKGALVTFQITLTRELEEEIRDFDMTVEEFFFGDIAFVTPDM